MYEDYMKKCFELAKQGLGKTSPNPLVGCIVLDKDGKEIATGFHSKYGENHAERDALLKLKNNEAQGGTLIVNLEPCSHYGKTPPCTDLIIEHKLKRVVIAMCDPNPKVLGIEKLEAAGIEVIQNVLEEDAKNLNEVFITNFTKKRPFVVIKTATTMDGKLATKTGSSKWITCAKSRERVYELRQIYDAVLTTSNTVIADNPSFNCPLKILIDRNLKTNFNKAFFNTGKILIAHDSRLPSISKPDNVEFIPCPVNNNQIDINYLLNALIQRSIMSIFVETGGTFNGDIVSKGLVDKIYHFTAPKILGDNAGKSAFDGRHINEISECVNFEVQDIERINNDILITYKKPV